VTSTPGLGFKSVTSVAPCPGGTVLLGGGYTLSGDFLQLEADVTESRPVAGAWSATARNFVSLLLGTFTIQAYAVCTT
jgi:hypothetical protein